MSLQESFTGVMGASKCVYSLGKNAGIFPLFHTLLLVFSSICTIFLFPKPSLAKGKGLWGWEGEGEEEGEGKRGLKRREARERQGASGGKVPALLSQRRATAGTARRRTAAATKARAFSPLEEGNETLFG